MPIGGSIGIEAGNDAGKRLTGRGEGKNKDGVIRAPTETIHGNVSGIDKKKAVTGVSEAVTDLPAQFDFFGPGVGGQQAPDGSVFGQESITVSGDRFIGMDNRG